MWRFCARRKWTLCTNVQKYVGKFASGVRTTHLRSTIRVVLLWVIFCLRNLVFHIVRALNDLRPPLNRVRSPYHQYSSPYSFRGHCWFNGITNTLPKFADVSLLVFSVYTCVSKYSPTFTTKPCLYMKLHTT